MKRGGKVAASRRRHRFRRPIANPLTGAAPDFPERIATLSYCAVPDDTPDTQQSQPISTAGPYYIASSNQSQLVLLRNPNYGGDRPREARKIVYSFGAKYAKAVSAVEAGTSDYVSATQLPLDANVPAGLLQTLENRYGIASSAARAGDERYFVNPTMSLNSFALNTTRPLFAPARMRRAVNYAIDRQALVEYSGPFFGGRAISHYLPPGMPGARPDNVYPLAPDLAAARKLAGNIHVHAAMYTCNSSFCKAEAEIVQRDLAPLGITVDVTSMSMSKDYTQLGTAGTPWDIGWQNWQWDFADPSDFLTNLFDPASLTNNSRFHDPGFVAAIRHAATLSGAARLANYGRLDDQLAKQAAPVVAWGTDAAKDFFAARVGCETYQPFYGMDLAKLCIRG
jgi:peptide/nickel transport system substrate-binding protein